MKYCAAGRVGGGRGRKERQQEYGE